jgi:hypothetical protein
VGSQSTSLLAFPSFKLPVEISHLVDIAPAGGEQNDPREAAPAERQERRRGWEGTMIEETLFPFEISRQGSVVC